MSKINIIGAGLSGLSVAVKLIAKNPRAEIEIFEASNKAGGRIKNFFCPSLGISLENPHLISQANKNALTFLKIIGANLEKPVKFKTTSYNPFSLYRLFVESVTNYPYENADKTKCFKIFLKSIKTMGVFYPARYKDFVTKSVDFIEKNGGKIHYNSNISNINDLEKSSIKIVATDAINLKRICNLDFETVENPIVNIHFKHNLGENFVMLCPDFSFPCVIFVEKSIISVTVSSAFRLVNYDNKNIANIFFKLIKNLFNIDSESLPYTVTKSKRATVKTNFKESLIQDKNCFVCSDFLDCLLPPTIESAISSGFKTADLL